MRDRAISLLKELTEAHGAPGFEDEVRAIFADELADTGELSADGQGSVFCELGEGPRVMITGHMDEVGFRVQSVTHDGFLKFVPLGGWWPHTLLSQRVEVMTRDGSKIMGVISSKPPHFLAESERSRVMGIEQLFIDVGARSKSDVEQNCGIRIGDSIVPATEFSQMHADDMYVAKAFDNRVGMACAIQACQALAATGHPNTLISCGTVQEEVGVRGAVTAANFAKPDVVIVLEGAPADDTPGFDRSASQGAVGKGVQVRIQDPTAISSPALVSMAETVTEEEAIPYQLTVRSGGGTDARAFQQSGIGVPVIVLGVPARYIHSHNSMIDINDYLAMVNLTMAMVQRLDQKRVDALTTFL